MDRADQDEREMLQSLAEQHGFSQQAVEHLFGAVAAGQSYQAQFNHPDLGGMGQWSQGGMVMIGDMFNTGLKARVDSLCSALADYVRSQPPKPFQSQQSQYQGNGAFSSGQASGFGGWAANWWPEELGQASSTGGQNDMRYAFFPQAQRLALDIGGRVTVYDTKGHNLAGFSQQQGSDQSLSFTSQHGPVRLSDLDVVPSHEQQAEVQAETGAADFAEAVDFAEPAAPVAQPREAPVRTETPVPPSSPPASSDDIFNTLERLAGLHAKGILTDDEFQAKKAELLARL